MAKYYKWNFDKIVIYPFGGCTKFDEKINRPMKEELLILISGPSIQIILFLIIIVLSKYGILTYRNLNFTLMGVLLLSEIILYFKRQNFLYNILLLERYMYSIKFNRVKVIDNKDSMYKDRKHVILYNGKYITEKDYLSKRFR